MLVATLNVVDKIAEFVFMLWAAALLIAMVRHSVKWTFLGPFELVGRVWRGEVGRTRS